MASLAPYDMHPFMGHQVPVWVIRSLCGSSGPFMDHWKRLCAHESSESLHGSLSWVIGFVNANGYVTCYDMIHVQVLNTNVTISMNLLCYDN